MADTYQVLNLAAIIREVDGSNNKGAAALAESILDHPRFRAVLAEEPAAVTGQPSDGEVAELVAWLQEEADDYDCIGCEDSAAKCNRAAELLERQALVPPADGEVVEVVEWLHTVVAAYKSCRNTDHIWSLSGNGVNARLTVTLLTRAAELLQRQRQAPQPPADGEVAELAAEIRHFLAGYQQMRGSDPEHIYSIHRGDKMEAHITVSRLTRAAELLQRQRQAPVSVSERPWEREGWCDVEGRFWAEHISRSGVASWRCAAASDLGGWAVRCLPAHALPLPEVGE